MEVKHINKLRARIDGDDDGNDEFTILGVGKFGMLLAFVATLFAIDAVFKGGQVSGTITNALMS